jgi:hypothetical protein
MKLELIRLHKEREVSKLTNGKGTSGSSIISVNKTKALQCMQLQQSELKDELQEQKMKHDAMQNEHDDMLESMHEKIHFLVLKLEQPPQDDDDNDEQTNIL